MSTKRRKKRLTNARSCRRFLAQIANEVYDGSLEPGTGGKLAYITSIIIKSIEVDEIEKRITELEKLTNGKVETYHTN